VRRFAIALIVAVSLGGPIVEMFDRWDQTLHDGNDTEASVVIVALCVGVALSVARVVAARIRVMALSRSDRLVVTSTAHRSISTASATPTPTISPPLPLRV